MRIAISGLSGFIGRHVAQAAQTRGLDIVALDRNALARAAKPGEWLPEDRRSLEARLESCSAIIHLAGLAHRRGSTPEQHDLINRLMSVRLGEAARECGTKRFVYVSSLSVYGHVAGSRTIDTRTSVAPTSAYGISKARAEEQLAALAASRQFEVLILRPPLVCGAFAPGNLGSLRAAILKGLPLPEIRDNERDLVGVRNLASALLQGASMGQSSAVIATPIADGTPLSTVDIIEEIARGARRRARFVPVPSFIRTFASAIGPLDRVLGPLWHSLRVDAPTIWEKLGIAPSLTTREELFAGGAGRTQSEL